MSQQLLSLRAPTQSVSDGRVWDVICIGSGMGCLAAAATLARAGRSVLVLEAHTQLGGLTHTFARRQVRWGTGLHYTGWPTSYYCDFPDLWETLTGGRAPWLRLPEETDHYLHPDRRFIKRGPRERYREDLLAEFPGERRAIDTYLADMRRITADYLRFMTLQSLPRFVERLGLGWWLGRRFLQKDRLGLVQYMDGLGASPRLRNCLWFGWGNFGGIPDETSVGAYAVPTEFMMDGLWTARDGSRGVADAFLATVRQNGGEVRRGTAVTGLVFRGGRVGGVCIGNDEIRGRTVISGIGARETYRLLVPPERHSRQAEAVLGMKSSCSIFTLYLALDPAVIGRYGLDGVNYWVEAKPSSMTGIWEDLDERPPWFVLSLAARFQHEGHGGSSGEAVIPAEVFVGVKGERFARWQATRVMRRGEDYSEFKARLTELTLAQVEATWPGFSRYVRFAEGATPLTIQSYTRHIDGAAYGVAPVAGRYSNRALRVASGVPGLLLTGQDISAAGVIGAFYGGLATASAVLWRDARTVLR